MRHQRWLSANPGRFQLDDLQRSSLARLRRRPDPALELLDRRQIGQGSLVTPAARPRNVARERAGFALAASAYLVLALLVFSAALREPYRLLPCFSLLERPELKPRALLDHLDQMMVASVVTRNADTIVRRPWNLFGDGHCFPMPHGYTLGEHMFGLGLLAAIPWAATTDPIFSFNVALVLTLWIAGLSMYALSRHFTGSPAAAFVAGLLFELAPRRLADPAHPYVHGDLWTPLALLFFHRLCTLDRWRDAAGFALFMTLALLESLYPLAALAILLAVYGPYALVRHRRRISRILPKLVACAVWISLVAGAVFLPYLRTRATWGVLGGRHVLLYSLHDYAPGRSAFPGFVLLVLVLVAVLDRLRGPRTVAGEDPRLAYLTGALLILGVTIGSWRIPILDLAFPSPLLMARGWLPGLDAVRALPTIGIGAGLPMAFLAGYGVLVLTERLPRLVECGVATLVGGAIVANAFVPALARPSFGVDSLASAAYPARPPDPDIALVQQAAEGAVLDLPFNWSGVRRLGMARDLLRISYSPRPTAACYNSYVSPVQAQVARLADQLPDPRAAEALHALGFGTVILEKEQLLPPLRKALFESIRRQPDTERRMTRLGRTEGLVAYRLSSTTPVESRFSSLVPDEADQGLEPIQVPPGGGEIEFSVRNTTAETFRHPDAIAPSELRLRWVDEHGRTVAEQSARGLLPIAVGAHSSIRITLPLAPPPLAGTYTVSVARAAEPERILLRRRVVTTH